MKTLVIHPEDSSTDFLKPIYAGIHDKTVVTKGDKSLVKDLIESHEKIIMMGHGCPTGLFAMGKFGRYDQTLGHIIDEETVPLLRDKTNIFIWCNADKFVEENGLKGFYSGMFISEVQEAFYLRVSKDSEFEYCDYLVKESNREFSKILSGVVEYPVYDIHRHVVKQYSEIAVHNKIAKYNLERLYKSS